MSTIELATNLLSAVQLDSASLDHLQQQLTEAQAQIASAKVEAASANAALASYITSHSDIQPATGIVAGDTSPGSSDSTEAQTTSAVAPLTLAAQVMADQIQLTASRPAQLIVRTTMKSAIIADSATVASAGPVVPGWTYWARAIDGADHSPEIQILIAGTPPKDQPYDHLWRVTAASANATGTNAQADASTSAGDSTSINGSATSSASVDAQSPTAIDLDALPATYTPPANAIVPRQGDDLQAAANLARSTNRPLFLTDLSITGKMLTLDSLKNVIIQRCTFTNIPGGLQVGHAIRILGGCPGLTVVNSSFSSTGAEAIMAWGDMTGTHIVGNHFANLFEGIHFPNYTGSGVLIASNTFTGIRRMAIELQGDGAINTTVDANTITYADLSTTYDGTFAISAVNRGTGTIVRNNTITGPSGNRTPGKWGVAIAIEFSGINGRCEGNKITGCNEGIHIVYARGAAISENTLTNTGDMAFWATGTEDASGAQVTHNTLINVNSGILFTGPSSRRLGLTLTNNTGTVRGDWIRGSSDGATFGQNSITKP